MANLFGTFGTGNINVVGGGGAATTTGSAATSQTDRINIGFAPRLNQTPTDTSGFTFTGQPITPAEYQSRKVDFTKEFIDSSLVGLGQQTGIDPTSTPGVGEDIQLAIADDDGGDDGTDLVDIYGTTFETITNPITGQSTLSEKTTSNNRFGYENVGKTDFNNYSDYLKASGNLDRVNLVENVFEPLFSADVPLSDFSFEGFTSTAQEAPAQAGKAVTETLKGKDLGKKFMSAAFSAGVPGFAGPVIGGLIGGEVRKNHFGEASLRPSGITGLLYDASMSAKFGAMTEIRAAHNAYVPGTIADLGFAAKIGGQSVLRRPNANAYLDDSGLSFQQKKNIEAFTKGYIVNTYTFDEQPGKNFFGQDTNVKVEDAGGAFAGQGYYTSDGKYYSARYQSVAASGPQSAIFDGARKAGVPKSVFEDAVMDARKGKGTVQENLDNYKKEKAAADKAAADKAAADKAAADKAAAQRQRNIEAGRQRLSGDFYSDDDDGPSISSSGPSRESAFDNVSDFEGLDPDDYAAGGTVGMAAGGAMAAGSSGFIGAPPSQVPEEKTVADDQLTEYPEGTFIINAAAVEEAGEADIVKMLNDAQKEAVRRGITVDKSENSAKLIDVAVSQGEVKVAPYLAKVIGYDRLRKINNRGKPEVAERQQEAAQGGMLGLKDGGTVTGPTRKPNMAQLGDVEMRADMEIFIQNDSLARLGYKLYEDRNLRFNAYIADPPQYGKDGELISGTQHSAGGSFHPAYGVRNDKSGDTYRIRPATDTVFAEGVKTQGVKSPIEDSVPHMFLVAGESISQDKFQYYITAAHELRHAALDYLSKKYNFDLENIAVEEQMMDYADLMARKKAAKLNPNVSKTFKIKEQDSRLKASSSIPEIKRKYDLYNGLAEEALMEEGYPAQTPAMEPEGFLTRGVKSLFN